MSLTSALSNSATGLNAAARGLKIIADNVANASTPGYVRRELDVNGSLSGGVSISPDHRADAPRLTAERRIADAGIGAAGTRADALARISNVFGMPGSADTLSAHLAKLEGAIGNAIISPENSPTLQQVTDAAEALAQKVVRIASELQDARQQADDRISEGVDQLNAGLETVERLNAAIVVGQVQGRETAALYDQRAAALDELASLVPLRVIPRETGEVSVFSARGAALLDGARAPITFDATNGLTLAQSVSTLPLIHGQADSAGLLGGGSLEADLDLRDRILPQMATELDGFTAELVTRFEAADPLRGTGPGLFAINGGALPPGGAPGTSLSISLAPQFDPRNGGTADALRDPGAPVTDPSRLVSLSAAFSDGDPPLETRAVTISVASHASANAAEAAVATQQAIGQTTRSAEQSVTAVDTDAEMQKLLRYETAYAANARVLAAVDDMLRRLMEI